MTRPGAGTKSASGPIYGPLPTSCRGGTAGERAKPDRGKQPVSRQIAPDCRPRYATRRPARREQVRQWPAAFTYNSRRAVHNQASFLRVKQRPRDAHAVVRRRQRGLSGEGSAEWRLRSAGSEGAAFGKRRGKLGFRQREHAGEHGGIQAPRARHPATPRCDSPRTAARRHGSAHRDFQTRRRRAGRERRRTARNSPDARPRIAGRRHSPACRPPSSSPR